MDPILAAALREGGPPNKPTWSDDDCRQALARVHWHGIAGLLAGQEGWPAAFMSAVTDEARARAMWELRHRQLLAPLLARLAEGGVPALLLKGTAFAYDLYQEPAQRARGDTDLWVPRHEVDRARAILMAGGFRRVSGIGEARALTLEEEWEQRAAGEASHVVDLHWSAVNSLRLSCLFDFDACWEQRRELKRLGPSAWGLSHEDALLHSAVHRQMHLVAPYQVDGVDHHGGDRIIWAEDIRRLSQALGQKGLAQAAENAARLGLGEALASALRAAEDWLEAVVPARLLQALESAPPTAVSHYLGAGQLTRAWLDLGEVQPLTARLAALGAKLTSGGLPLARQRLARITAPLQGRG